MAKVVRAVFALGVAGMSVPAAAEWTRYEAPHFTIYSESSPEKVEVLASRSRRWTR